MAEETRPEAEDPMQRIFEWLDDEEQADGLKR